MSTKLRQTTLAAPPDPPPCPTRTLPLTSRNPTGPARPTGRYALGAGGGGSNPPSPTDTPLLGEPPRSELEQALSTFGWRSRTGPRAAPQPKDRAGADRSRLAATLRGSCGRSSTVERQPSKLVTRVRLPSPARRSSVLTEPMTVPRSRPTLDGGCSRPAPGRRPGAAAAGAAARPQHLPRGRRDARWRSTWSTVSPPYPPPLAYASAVYDSDSKTVVLFGGVDRTAASPTTPGSGTARPGRTTPGRRSRLRRPGAGLHGLRPQAPPAHPFRW